MRNFLNVLLHFTLLNRNEVGSGTQKEMNCFNSDDHNADTDSNAYDLQLSNNTLSMAINN